MSNFYSLEAVSLKGDPVSFEQFQGKAVLVVNTASKCGFTPQFEGLEKLYRQYQNDGLVILGFPCNQFGNQDPGGKESIEQVCYQNYGVTFPMFEKINVNGKDSHAVFKFLKKELPGTLGGSIKWNFTKFLISRDGTPLKRYAPNTPPSALEEDLRKALGLS